MYIVMIERIQEHHSIFRIQNQKNNLQIYVLLENLHRKTSLFKDFPHLYPEVYLSEQAFQQDNAGYNLIKLILLPEFDIEKLSETKKGRIIVEEFSYMAESLVEHQYKTDHAVCWIENNAIASLQQLYSYEKEELWRQSIVDYIFSFAENPPLDTKKTYLF